MFYHTAVLNTKPSQEQTSGSVIFLDVSMTQAQCTKHLLYFPSNLETTPVQAPHASALLRLVPGFLFCDMLLLSQKGEGPPSFCCGFPLGSFITRRFSPTEQSSSRSDIVVPIAQKLTCWAIEVSSVSRKLAFATHPVCSSLLPLLPGKASVLTRASASSHSAPRNWT